MNMRLVFCLCVAVASAVLAHPALSQQPARVALLIGNANYPDASTPLSTTIRDARTLADEFRRTEFDVDLKENVGREDMQRAIDAFIGKIRPGMVALFYFSGYGIQVARQTYLIPVNAQAAGGDAAQRRQSKDRHYRCVPTQPVRASLSGVGSGARRARCA